MNMALEKRKCSHAKNISSNLSKLLKAFQSLWEVENELRWITLTLQLIQIVLAVTLFHCKKHTVN